MTATTDTQAREATIRDALNLALDHALAADERVFLLGEDIADPMGGSYKITAGLSGKYGSHRVRNTPIAEAGIVGAAVGAAIAGMRPIAELMYIDFTTVAMDQIVNQAAFISYMSGGQVAVPMVIRCQGGGWRSSAAQHSKSLESWFTHVPGLKFMMPADANDAYWLLRAAIDDPNPVIFYEPNLLYRERSILDISEPPHALGEPRVIRPGTDATLVSWGMTTPMALTAAASLSREHGIELEVIGVTTLAPLNFAPIISSVQRTGLLAVAHEAWEYGGFGAEIAARVSADAFFYLDGPIKRIGALHCPHPFSPALEQAMMPSEQRIVSEVRAWFGKPE
jgi:acetoin:2,6-dichlorophenolindophenol oxidoreductase subunit beta